MGDENVALLTDLYELLMAQGYWIEGMHDEAVFSLYCRRLPPGRNYLLACGQDTALACIESLRFTDDVVEYLSTFPWLTADFLRWLRSFRFTGNVYAVPEGTPVFPGEPILEVAAPIAEAQLLETLVMNQLHFQTVIASKASRMVTAAGKRPITDFGLRRIHGADAGLKGARAGYVAGVASTSNVLAGQLYSIPVAGTMGHSYVQAHYREIDAFRAFVRLYPDSVLVVDTYDTTQGVADVIALAREMGPSFRVRGIRLDSGDLRSLSEQARRALDDAGLGRVQIFASGGLDEWEIARLVRDRAPIDGYGVGAALDNVPDGPVLDFAYKLVSYAGRGRMKTSPAKETLPGQKQIFRVVERGVAVRDVLARWGEPAMGRPLMVPVIGKGRRLPTALDPASTARERARRERGLLPDSILSLETADPPYPVTISSELEALRQATLAALATLAG